MRLTPRLFIGKWIIWLGVMILPKKSRDAALCIIVAGTKLAKTAMGTKP
jgi:hypothetical protein